MALELVEARLFAKERRMTMTLMAAIRRQVPFVRSESVAELCICCPAPLPQQPWQPAH